MTGLKRLTPVSYTHLDVYKRQGREGELIFRFVYEMAGCKKPMRRLWISSMEDLSLIHI